MKPAKITAIKVKRVPLKNTHEILVVANNFDPRKHRIILRVNGKFYPTLKDYFVQELILPVPSLNTQDVIIYAQLFDYKKDKVIDTRKQGFHNILSYWVEKDELSITTDAYFNPFWNKDRRMLKVEGPFDKEGKLQTAVNLGQRYYFRATPNQNLHQVELLSAHWAFRYDDGKVIPLENHNESTRNGYNIMDCTFQEKSKGIKVYAYFQELSEEVMVEFSNLGKTQEKEEKVGEEKVKEQEKTDTACICKEQYKDLVWGGKVSCEFRKKVVSISKRSNVDPNHLMTAMALETAGTFDSTSGTFKKKKNEESEGYVGLLQIGKDAAAQLKVTRTELLEMSQIEQLDYVEKYINLPFLKGKLKTLTDFYLAVLFPIDCGKGNKPNHIVFDNSLPISYGNNGKPIKNINYWRNVGYAANPAFHKEKEKESGKTYVWEIADKIKGLYNEGKKHKVGTFSCQDEVVEPKIENTKEAKWHDPVDDPQLCLYTQKGNYRPRYNVFGKVRKERDNPKHQGIDFLALPGSNVYACVDAYVEFIDVQKEYGNVLCLRVKDKEAFLKRKRDFKLLYSSEGEILEGPEFKYNGNFYLFYAHLQKINISKDTKEVKCGSIIGLNGTSGYGSSKDPHLHFEIRSKPRSSGLENRCHPGIFVYYKGENDMSQSEKNHHKEIAKKDWN